MEDLTAPQRVVANAGYPYDAQVAQAREQLARMGIDDVKPLYAPGVRAANGDLPGRRSHLNRLIRTALADRLAG